MNQDSNITDTDTKKTRKGRTNNTKTPPKQTTNTTQTQLHSTPPNQTTDTARTQNGVCDKQTDFKMVQIHAYTLISLHMVT